MPSLENHESSEFTRILYLGHSGSGKTGSLVSLVRAGYHLRIIDLDNGLEALVHQIKLQCPERLGQVYYENARDEYKMTPLGLKLKGSPKAFQTTLNLLDKWTDGSNPAAWGPTHVLVIDSLTALGRAALAFTEHANPSYKDPRLWYGPAQDYVEKTISMLTSPSFRTNVLVLTHIDRVEQDDGTTKAFASAIGKSLGPKLPRAFNTMIQATSKGSGEKVTRTIRTVPSVELDLKVPATVPAEYPLNDGLATLFKALRG